MHGPIVATKTIDLHSCICRGGSCLVSPGARRILLVPSARRRAMFDTLFGESYPGWATSYFRRGCINNEPVECAHFFFLMTLLPCLACPPAQMELDGVPPDTISYKQALRACRAGAGVSMDGRAAHRALALIEDVRSKGLGPDVVSLEGAARWVSCVVWFGFRPEFARPLTGNCVKTSALFCREKNMMPATND